MDNIAPIDDHSLVHCFACLSSDGITSNVNENPTIKEEFQKTFNFEIKFLDGFPTDFCENCQDQLRKSSEFLCQIKANIEFFENCIKEAENKEVKSEKLVPKETNSETESDNEPLSKWIVKKKRRKKVGCPKLQRVPLKLVEHAIEEYREICKQNSKCILCDFKGLNIRTLSCHMLFKHKEQKNHWCLRCNLLVVDLESHKETHTNKVWCKFCEKGITRCHFLEHVKNHAGLGYSYEECCKRFIARNCLREHMSEHATEKPFQCHICNKPFKLVKNLEDHIQTHGRYRCEICEKNFEIPELLQSHFCSGQTMKSDEIIDQKLHSGFDEQLKDYNGLQLDDFKMIEADIKDEIKTEDVCAKLKTGMRVESLTCHFCQRSYKTSYKLQKHIEAHMGIFLVKCKYCDKGFSSKADLTSHERVHTKEKPFICTACGKGFVSGTTLRIHMKQHTGKPEVCELCHKRFCRKSELKLHLQKHKGERPFLCTDCGKSFSQKSHLTSHLTMHNEERPYSCELCDRAFKKKALLKDHMKLHGDKSFKCSICFYECHRKYRLQQHMQMHEGKTGIKVNPCQLCNRSFSTVQFLNIHMGNVHNVIV